MTGATSVSQGLVFLILLGAAVLEAGGDALVRKGLQSRGLVQQVEFILLGGLTLLGYGICPGIRTSFPRLGTQWHSRSPHITADATRHDGDNHFKRSTIKT